MLHDKIPVKGRLKIQLNGETVRDIDNLVVAAGKAFVASRMAGTTDAVMSHMALGTNTAAAAAGDTALGAEVGRVALTSTTVLNNEITYTAYFAPGVATGAITEAGIFNATPAGTMLARTVFSPVNKGASDSITITWTVTVS